MLRLNKEQFHGMSDEMAESCVGKKLYIKLEESDTPIEGIITGLLRFDPIKYEEYKECGQSKYMGIIVGEIKVSFDSHVEYAIIDEEDVISRRDFFRRGVKSSIPIIAIAIIGNFALQSCDALAPNCSNCANGCDDTCHNSCKGCKGTCKGRCGGDCFAICNGECINSCKGGCRYSCLNSASI